MTERKKLIQLLETTLYGNICYNCESSRQYKDQDSVIEATADYLLANGVVIMSTKVEDETLEKKKLTTLMR